MTTPTPFTIRRLGPDDINQVRDLLAVFGEAFEDVPIYTGAQPDRHYLDRLLGSETVVVLVAL